MEEGVNYIYERRNRVPHKRQSWLQLRYETEPAQKIKTLRSVTMEVVLTRLRDFSCRTSTFEDNNEEQGHLCRDPHLRGGGSAGGQGTKLDLESALAWLRMELVRLNHQDSLSFYVRGVVGHQSVSYLQQTAGCVI